MKAYRALLRKEIADLFFTKTALLLALVIGPLLGYSFYSAVTLYGNASVAAVGNPLYASGFEPVPGVFVPAYGGLFLIFSLFLPFLFIPLIGRERRYNTLTLLLQLPFRLGGILAAKILAAFLFLCFIVLLSLPAVLLWLGWGGHLALGELLLVAAGYGLYGLLVLSVSLLASALFKDTASASVFAVAILILSWLVDFGKDLYLSPLLTGLSRWTVTSQLKVFEDGILSLRACAYFAVLSAGLWAVSYVLLRFDLRRKWRWFLTILVFSCAMLFGVSRLTLNRDVTESGRNSFSPPVAKALKRIPGFEVNAYLQPADSRFKDYERSFLEKLFLIRNDVKVTLMTGEALKENYGLFVYRVRGRSEKTYSNSEEEIFPILFQLAGIKADSSPGGPGYPGYPLVTTGRQQAAVWYVYLGFIPGFILLVFLTRNFYLTRRGRR